MDVRSCDCRWMRHALMLAAHAAKIGEVPIGAVLVKNGEILAESWNQPISDHDPTAHAEILSLRMAANIQKNYRLPDTTLYVTLEPCLMCFGALVNARVKRLVYGASDTRFGVIKDLGDKLNFNHQIEVSGGVLKQECAQILSDFFKTRRNTASTDIAE